VLTAVREPSDKEIQLFRLLAQVAGMVSQPTERNVRFRLPPKCDDPAQDSSFPRPIQGVVANPVTFMCDDYDGLLRGLPPNAKKRDERGKLNHLISAAFAKANEMAGTEPVIVNGSNDDAVYQAYWLYVMHGNIAAGGGHVFHVAVRPGKIGLAIRNLRRHCHSSAPA
jgi:hypothetical protein